MYNLVPTNPKPANVCEKDKLERPPTLHSVVALLEILSTHSVAQKASWKLNRQLLTETQYGDKGWPSDGAVRPAEPLISNTEKQLEDERTHGEEKKKTKQD